MTQQEQPTPMKAIRTYPQPDSPKLGSSPRNRALAVFKYLLNLEPEQAKDHPLFACIEHAFNQEGNAARNKAWLDEGIREEPLDDSYIPEMEAGEIPLVWRPAPNGTK